MGEGSDPPVDLPDGTVRALVVHPHPLTRIGLGVLLHRQRWVGHCVLSGDRDEAIPLVKRHRPDVAIVDVSPAGPFVSSFLAPLRRVRPSMRLLLSADCAGFNHGQIRAVAGGVPVLTPDLSVEQVLDAVRATVTEREPPAWRDREQPESLSGRERQVLALLCTGATNREIAAEMQVGTETVKKHAGTLYRKLGVRNRTEAVQRAATMLLTAG